MQLACILAHYLANILALLDTTADILSGILSIWLSTGAHCDLVLVEEEEEQRTALIKCNNPQLAGGDEEHI